MLVLGLCRIICCWVKNLSPHQNRKINLLCCRNCQWKKWIHISFPQKPLISVTPLLMQYLSGVLPYFLPTMVGPVKLLKFYLLQDYLKLGEKNIRGGYLLWFIYLWYQFTYFLYFPSTVPDQQDSACCKRLADPHCVMMKKLWKMASTSLLFKYYFENPNNNNVIFGSGGEYKNPPNMTITMTMTGGPSIDLCHFGSSSASTASSTN